MKSSKYIFKAVTPVMALFQKQHRCLSNKATTICGRSAESLRQVPVRHNRRGVFTEIKVRFSPPTMCRLTQRNGQKKTISSDRVLRISRRYKMSGTRISAADFLHNRIQSFSDSKNEISAVKYCRVLQSRNQSQIFCHFSGFDCF